MKLTKQEFIIGQIAPHLFCEEGTVEVLTKEMERGQFNRDCFRKCVSDLLT